MQLRAMELFCDVAVWQSFSKAAAEHQISQPSVSQIISQLEKRLGVTLINRSLRPLQLTEAGEIYLEGCREILERYRSLEDRVRQGRAHVSGVVRVAAIYSVGLLQMEWHVRQFSALYPDAELVLEYVHPDEVYDRVRHDHADLGLISFPTNSSDFERLTWQLQPMLLVAPPDHRLAGRKNCSVQELRGENFIGFTRDLAIRREVDKWLRAAHVSVELTHEFDTIENVKQAISVGSGVGLLPAPTVSREVSAGLLCAIELNDVQWSRPLAIITRRNKVLTTAVQKAILLLQGAAIPTESVAAPRSRSTQKPAESARNKPDNESATVSNAIPMNTAVTERKPERDSSDSNVAAGNHRAAKRSRTQRLTAVSNAKRPKPKPTSETSSVATRRGKLSGSRSPRKPD